MEGINDAISNSNNQTQQPATTIVSTLTTVSHVTPLTSQVDDEFEPDSKWEITTLEKASYDCCDIYMDTSLDSQQPQTANGNDEQEPSQQPEQQLNLQEQQQLKQPSDTSNEKESQNIKEQIKDSARLVEKPYQVVTPEITYHQPVVSTENNDCFISLHSMVNAAPETSNETLPAVTTQPGEEVTKSDDGKVEQNNRTDKTNKQLETSHQVTSEKGAVDRQIGQKQHPTSDGSGMNTDQPSEGSSNCVLSQSSVDAQMETVIDHAVELGGGHQFSQALGQEDKEKAVENIQREIIGFRNPMESLAEVASQQPIMTEGLKVEEKRPVNQPPESTASTSAKVPSHETDLRQKKNSVPEEETTSQQPQAKDNGEDASVAAKSPNRQKASGTLVNEDHGDSGTEEGIVATKERWNIPNKKESSPIVEEPNANVEEIAPKRSNSVVEDAASVVEEAARIVEETVEVVEGSIGAVEDPAASDQPCPVVEEAPSADESDNEKGSEKESADADVLIIDQGQAAKLIEESSKEDRMEVEGHSESTTRRSSRKVKAKREVVESPKLEARRSSVRSRGRKDADTEKNPEIVDDVVEENVKMGADEVDNDEKAHSDSDEKLEQIVTEPVNASPKQGRPSRSMRTRAPKRPLEEESPQVETNRKCVKRSRGTDEHNKSYEATKNTPTIKLPYKSRATISTSDPATRSDTRYEVYDHDGGSNRKYRCNNCRYSTDRLNNIVFHHKRSNEFVSGVRCPGVLRAAEEQRAEIIRQQQTPKGNKRRSLR